VKLDNTPLGTAKMYSLYLSPYSNNQAFYFQASWGRLEMKPHEKKNRYKTRAKNKRKTKGDKKTKSKKGEKTSF
jgi:hypothetical protein